MVESADVVFLRVPVFVGDGDDERDGHIVTVLAFFCAKACAVDFLLERSHGFVLVDDATAAVGDGECSSACEVQRVVGESDDSLACEEVVARSAYVWFWSWGVWCSARARASANVCGRERGGSKTLCWWS